MKPENKAFLEANRHHWITLRDAFYVRHLDGNTRSEMQRIMGEEFRPGYTSDLWCPTCVADMVRAVYQEFEKWEHQQALIDFRPTIDDFAKQKNELIEMWLRENAGKPAIGIDLATGDDLTIYAKVENGEVTEITKEEAEAIKDDPASVTVPIQPVKANFPSHKKRRR